VPIEWDVSLSRERNRTGLWFELKFFNVLPILELQGEFKAREAASMRIDLNYGPQAMPESTRTDAQNGTAAHRSPSISTGDVSGALSAGGNGEDQAHLSGAHGEVEALAAQAAQLPEVRQGRVQALRQILVRGEYQPAPEQVAGAMLESMTVAPMM
jgi:flagellar biosynthesis anti-sigma factor FlgM